MNIIKFIASKLSDNFSLRNVPQPIIDAVVADTFDAIREHVDAASAHLLSPTTVDELLDDGWSACEACDALFREDNGGGMTNIGEDCIDLCNDCAKSPAP